MRSFKRAYLAARLLARFLALHPVQQARRACKVLQVQLELKDLQARQVLQVPQVLIQQFRVQQARQDPPGQQALIQLSPVQPGLRVLLDPPDPRGLLAPPDQLVLTLLFPVLLVLRGLQAIPAPLVLPDLLARRVMLAPLDPLALPDPKEILAQLGLLDLRVIRVFRAFKAQLGLPGQQGLQDLPGLKAILDLPDQPDLLAFKVTLDPLGLLVRKEHRPIYSCIAPILVLRVAIRVMVTSFGTAAHKQVRLLSMSAI